jgi:uncharacterized membrane protein YqgA involved in biofilm formation
MGKRTITYFAIGGMTVGGALPMAFGDYNTFDTWSLLGGFIGGILGIVMGVWVSKRF